MKFILLTLLILSTPIFSFPQNITVKSMDKPACHSVENIEVGMDYQLVDTILELKLKPSNSTFETFKTKNFDLHFFKNKLWRIEVKKGQTKCPTRKGWYLKDDIRVSETGCGYNITDMFRWREIVSHVNDIK